MQILNILYNYEKYIPQVGAKIKNITHCYICSLYNNQYSAIKAKDGMLKICEDDKDNKKNEEKNIRKKGNKRKERGKEGRGIRQLLAATGKQG